MNKIPKDVVAERNLLGSLMLGDNEAVLHTLHTLTTSDFYDVESQAIFDIITGLHKAQEPIDIVTVNEKFDNLPLLSAMASGIGTSSNYKHYCNIVKAKSIRRQYIKAAEEVIRLSTQGQYSNIVEYADDCSKAMDIDIGSNTTDNTKIKEIGKTVFESLEESYKNGESLVTKSGIPFIDRIAGGINVDYTVVAARPSVGKTALIVNMAVNMAMQGKKVVIFSLEMTKEDLVKRMLSIVSGVKSDKIQKAWTMQDEDWVKVSKAIALFDKHITIFDNVFGVEEIRHRCRQEYDKEKFDIVFVDYLQLVGSRNKHEGSNQKVTHISRCFKMFQKEFNVPFWVLSQLSRECEKDKRQPKLSDLRESGSIEQDADKVFFLHDRNYGTYEGEGDKPDIEELQIIAAKQRTGIRDAANIITYDKSIQKMY